MIDINSIVMKEKGAISKLNDTLSFYFIVTIVAPNPYS